MGIRFTCPSGHKLHVKTFLAGKRGVCPHCGARFVIPSQEPQQSPHTSALVGSGIVAAPTETTASIIIAVAEEPVVAASPVDGNVAELPLAEHFAPPPVVAAPILPVEPPALPTEPAVPPPALISTRFDVESPAAYHQSRRQRHRRKQLQIAIVLLVTVIFLALVLILVIQRGGVAPPTNGPQSGQSRNASVSAASHPSVWWQVGTLGDFLS
jgi:hypothetical protein